jgi:anaerobic selenocysteine-containing dehydrogenase/Fe-S-cluster-containing dehydrogenase component
MSQVRRNFLKILGLGSAAGFTGCSRTAPEALVPYVKPPEEMVRGHALWFRSTCRECPAGCGIEARVREGRVHKVEGNPLHPVNAGGLCARGQAAVQGLYNPDRLRSPMIRDDKGVLKPVSWDEAEKQFVERLDKVRGKIGVITGSVTGAMAELIRLWLASFNSTRHIQYEPIAYEDLRAANKLCFGVDSLPVLRFAEAGAIYCFGAGVIETFLSPVGYARGIAEARRNGGRMVYIGSRLSLTGARADQWIPVQPGGEALVAMALVREILQKWSDPFTPARAGVPADVIRALARELVAKPSLAIAGPELSTAIAVNLLNVATGAINKTVQFNRACALDRATSTIDAGSLEAAVVADCNPVYSSPALKKAPLLVALSSYQDETVAAAHIVLPILTPLESWGDYEPWTGIHSIQQPAMTPVFPVRELGDIFIRTAKIPAPNFREFLRSRWRKLHQESGGKLDFESFWAASLQRGGYWRDVPERKVAMGAPPVLPATPRPAAKGYRLQTYPSLALFDGRGANRPWLQELPDPVTLAVWDNWIEIHPQDATRLGVKTGNRVRVRSAHGEIELPAYVYPGVYPGSVAIPLGQGHTSFGRYATGVGANPMKLLAATGVLRLSGEIVGIQPVARGHELVVTSGHDLQEHREIARSRIVPGKPEARHSERELSVYAPHEHKTHRWGMAIDLDACNGCSACVTACYAENNLPVVGKEEVDRGREMSWIRLERFYGAGSELSRPFQIDLTPMLCQQCDNAPCEPVCPVFAAFHTQEGLNGQVYNRCVGTRYCSNNCPYKVRRFNWYEAQWPAPLDWQLNPDVTVRTKGVMEKCTFCVQRIVEAKDRARREGRSLADGDVTPACAQTCPTQAIMFGDLKDEKSRVRRLLENTRGYRVLEELNTRPAVTYLERERRKV